MEQVNQEIEAYLWVFVSHCQDDWADWLPLAKFAYNNHVHSTTCHTPFELDSGQHQWMGSEPTWSSAVEAADNFAQQMSQMQDEAKAALEHAVDEMAWYYDRWRSPAPTVGRILVPCANRLYGPVLTLWMYLAHYESRILQSGCFF